MNSKLKGSLLVFAGACSFGVLSTIVKCAYQYNYTLGEVTGSQTFIGMVVLWLCVFVMNKRAIKTNRAQGVNSKITSILKVIVAGVFTGLVGIFYYKCVSLIPASIAIILLMQNVWMTFIIETICFKKKPTSIQLFAMCLVLVGTVFAAGLFNSKLELDLMGLIYGLLAAFSYSVFIITSGRFGNDLPVIQKSAWMITGACLITFILFPPITLWAKLAVGGLMPWAIALALFGTVVPPFLFAKGVPMTGVSLGAILGAAELPVAVIASYVFLQESVSALQILGIVVILFAIIAVNYKH